MNPSTSRKFTEDAEMSLPVCRTAVKPLSCSGVSMYQVGPVWWQRTARTPESLPSMLTDAVVPPSAGSGAEHAAIPSTAIPAPATPATSRILMATDSMRSTLSAGQKRALDAFGRPATTRSTPLDRPARASTLRGPVHRGLRPSRPVHHQTPQSTIGRRGIGAPSPRPGEQYRTQRSAAAVASSAGRNASILSSAAVRSNAVPKVVTTLRNVNRPPSKVSSSRGTATPPSSVGAEPPG